VDGWGMRDHRGLKKAHDPPGWAFARSASALAAHGDSKFTLLFDFRKERKAGRESRVTACDSYLRASAQRLISFARWERRLVAGREALVISELAAEMTRAGALALGLNCLRLLHGGGFTAVQAPAGPFHASSKEFRMPLCDGCQWQGEMKGKLFV